MSRCENLSRLLHYFFIKISDLHGNNSWNLEYFRSNKNLCSLFNCKFHTIIFIRPAMEIYFIPLRPPSSSRIKLQLEKLLDSLRETRGPAFFSDVRTFLRLNSLHNPLSGRQTSTKPSPPPIIIIIITKRTYSPSRNENSEGRRKIPR